MNNTFESLKSYFENNSMDDIKKEWEEYSGYDNIDFTIEELESTIQDSTRQLEILKECLKIINPLEYPKRFNSKEDLEKWLEKNDIEFKWCNTFDNDDWKYIDLQDFEHLYRDGIELTKDLKAKQVYSYDNGRWKYEDEYGDWHKFDKNNKEIL